MRSGVLREESSLSRAQAAQRDCVLVRVSYARPAYITRRVYYRPLPNLKTPTPTDFDMAPIAQPVAQGSRRQVTVRHLDPLSAIRSAG